MVEPSLRLRRARASSERRASTGGVGGGAQEVPSFSSLRPCGHRRKTRRHRLLSRHHRAGERAPSPPGLCPAGPPTTARRRGRGEGAGARQQRSPPCRPRVRRHGDWADSIGFSPRSLRLFTDSLFLRVDAILGFSIADVKSDCTPNNKGWITVYKLTPG
jgi:hypothetical protein